MCKRPVRAQYDSACGPTIAMRVPGPMPRAAGSSRAIFTGRLPTRSDRRAACATRVLLESNAKPQHQHDRRAAAPATARRAAANWTARQLEIARRRARHPEQNREESRADAQNVRHKRRKEKFRYRVAEQHGENPQDSAPCGHEHADDHSSDHGRDECQAEDRRRAQRLEPDRGSRYPSSASRGSIRRGSGSVASSTSVAPSTNGMM